MILATASAFALADDDTPSRVGRISLAQGQVDISGEQGDEAEPALVNWPVTSNSQLTTGRDSRTEVRIGSTALRLDADTSIDVNALEDDSLRITLHYGSLSIRVRNPDVLRGFELDTPQGTIRLQDTGRVRVDAGRRADTTALSVFEGEATFDGAGSRLIVPRCRKRAEVTRDDVRTGLALRDSFDEWGMMRDVRDERSESVRYVTSEMTGYEDLDQHGAWSQDREYGPVWYPRTVSGLAGYLTATAAGPICSHGAGPGSTMRRGATRPSTTAAGSPLAAAGAGRQGAMSRAPSGPRPWWAGLAAATGT
ncbi:FecR domain-containing protein [Massilia sp. H-1]|nr:FecR domain-containing protein [Massilia sp. H-1]